MFMDVDRIWVGRVSRWLCTASVALMIVLGGCDDGLSSNDPSFFDPPLFISTQEDTPIDIQIAPISTGLTLTGASAEPHQVSISDDGTSLHVTPARDFNGDFSVSYTVADGMGRTTSDTLAVTVEPVNDAPVTPDVQVTAQGSLDIKLAASDVDDDFLITTILELPSHGTLLGVPPDVEYVPDPDFAGLDFFTYQASDLLLSSKPGRVQIQVGSTAPPVANDQTVSLIENLPRLITLSGFDPGGKFVSISLATSPVHGTLSGDPPNVLYTPNLNFVGDDSFTFTVQAGRQTATGTVTLHVRQGNGAPSANAQTVSTSEDTPVALTLSGSDPDGDVLSFVVDQPQHGAVTGSGASWTYTPAANFNGTDGFTFRTSDGVLSSSPATVTIHVAAVADPPIAVDSAVTTNEDTPVTFALQASDPDGDPLAFTVGLPAHGTLTGSPSALTYHPAGDYNGPDSFTFSVTANGDASNVATVSITVNAVNDPPVAVDGSVTTDEDTPVSITLQATDIDSTSFTFSVASSPTDGTLTGTGANLTYTPARNVNGTRSFQFRVTDDKGGVAFGTETITIAPVNDPPTPVDDYAATDPGVELTFDVVGNDTDPEGDPVHLDSVARPAHGEIEMVDGKLQYTPDAGFTGIDVFAYTAADSHGALATGTAHVGVGTFPPSAPFDSFGAVSTVSLNNPEFAPSISSDGRFVAFTTTVALVTDDTNGVQDVYVYDRGTRTMTRASVASDGAQGNDVSQRPTLSADGRYVVFESIATNLVAGDTNAATDVFRHDRITGETIRVSVAASGAQGNGASSHPRISADGSVVAFSSIAFNLVDNDANGAFDVFVRDVAAGTTERVSVSSAGGEGDLGAVDLALSGDGRKVAFASTATNLVAGDTNNVSDIFVHDRVANTTVRVSVSSTGGEANAACSKPAISADGRFVSFLSSATTLVATTSTVTQLYVRDLQAVTTTRPVTQGATALWGWLSGNGQFVTLLSGQTVIADRFAATSSSLGAELARVWPVVSNNGAYVVALSVGFGSTPGSVVVLPNVLAPVP